MTTLLRIIALLMGGAALGLTLIIAVLYHQAWRYLNSNSMVTSRHVAYIGVGHSLLIVALMASILVRVQQHSDFSWWVTPFAFVGFLFTILAHVQLLRSRRLRGLHAEVQGHIHF